MKKITSGIPKTWVIILYVTRCPHKHTYEARNCSPGEHRPFQTRPKFICDRKWTAVSL